MREHEVPTHVEAEDRVLLWFTFPQIVAMVAVCALSYGVYRYAPVGPTELRIGIAVIFGICGIAMVVGKIAGRRLPLVVADLLRYRLGPRRYVGEVSQLVRSAAPEPMKPVKDSPSPLTLMIRGVRRGGRRLGDMTESARRRIRRMRLSRDNDGKGSPGRKKRSRKSPGLWKAVFIVAMAITATALPQGAMADEGWRDEIDFELLDPVPGRRLFVEGLTVTSDKASVTLRAATDLRVTVQAYGGRYGTKLVSWATARLEQGERAAYDLPLDGPYPSFTFSWEDSLGQAGAFSLGGGQIPHPLPVAEGEICDLTVTSLGWTPGVIEGVVESECEDRVRKLIALNAVSGHVSVGEMSLMDADVTAITGVVSAVTTGSRTAVPLVPNGETSFRLDVRTEETVFHVFIVVEEEARLSIPLPPLTRLTHHPERTEHHTTTVTLTRPGTSRTVSETVTVEHEDGTTTEHTISAILSIPSRKVLKQVTIPILHPEHVKAEVEQRDPAIRSRTETLDMAASIASDEPFKALNLPTREPELPPSEQRPADSDEVGRWFEGFGWEWPW